MKLFSVPKNKKKPALFIDRDGVINKDREGKYITNENQIKLYSSAIKGLRKINPDIYHIIILTNQSAIGRKMVTEKKSRSINFHIIKKLKENGIKIDALYYCPHSPQDRCSCRKPLTGLIKEAKKDFLINIKNSYMLGDKNSDMLMAKKAGIKRIFVKTGQAKRQLKKYNVEYDFALENLSKIERILK